MILLLGFFFLSIIFSFLCSIWEAVLLSITPSYIKRKEQENPSLAKLLHRLKDNIDQSLSAILTLNTIAHTVGAIGVGAQAGKLYGTSSFGILGLQLTYESLIAVVMTLGILFLSEIIPKTLGANNWKSLAPFTARSLNVLIWVLKPLVWISTGITKKLKSSESAGYFSKKDFAAMAEIVSETGELDQEDYVLIKNLLEFDDLKVEDVMTPRIVMVTADQSQTLREFYSGQERFTFSRIPLYEGSKDHITGLMLKDDLLMGLIEGKDDDKLADIRRDIVFVNKEMSLRNVFQKLNEKREHLAVVLDEFGGLDGLVTLEDVIETLLGLEILDETDRVSDLQSFARKKWEERAKRLGLIK
jgi:CBS domain containing-hemolysin-like protein